MDHLTIIRRTTNNPGFGRALVHFGTDHGDSNVLAPRCCLLHLKVLDYFKNVAPPNPASGFADGALRPNCAKLCATIAWSGLGHQT
jgi:hypothetical protein